MKPVLSSTNDKVVSNLNSLLRGEISAVETYNQAIKQLAQEPLDDLIEKYHVSVHVARQSKRFDPYKTERGQVVIKTLPDEATGQKKTYVWRAPDVAK